MVVTQALSFTLEQFLKQSETEPASEYIDGKIFQKPMPKGRHSRLQGKLCAVINQVTEEGAIAYAFPELRCTVGERSLVPDVAVFHWERLPLAPTGEVPDRFDIAPDWTIEILSPDQSPNRVIGNILHLIQWGCALGWLIDPTDNSILVFTPEQSPRLLKGGKILPVLPVIQLTLTVDQVFGWLLMGKQQ